MRFLTKTRNLNALTLKRGNNVSQIQKTHDQSSRCFQRGKFCGFCRNKLYPYKIAFSITDVHFVPNNQLVIFEFKIYGCGSAGSKVVQFCKPQLTSSIHKKIRPAG